MNSPDNYSFLPLFIDTPIYLIKKEELDQKEVKVDNHLNKSQITQPEEKKLKIYGHNKNEIAIIVNYSNGDFLKSDEFNLLLKICSAVSLSLNEIAIVNSFENNHIDSNELSSLLSYNKLINFGNAWNPSGLTDNHQLYKPVYIQDKTMLLADDLSNLITDVKAKRALWNSLKNLFAKN